MSPLEQLSKRIKDKGGFHLNQNIISYLICVVIASCLWLMNALNQEDYAARLTYPVRYTNLPPDKYPTVALPDKIELEVKAKGFALLRYKIQTSFQPIILNAATYLSHLKSDGKRFSYTLNTAGIKEKIGSQLSPDIKLLNILPEEIRFEFAEASRKKVAVRPDVSYTLKKQFILNSISCQPDSIWISGPAPLLDTLGSIPTCPLELEKIGKRTRRKVQLSKIPNCLFQERETEITMEVEQFTEADRTLPIVALNVPDSMNIRLFPSNVRISYEVGLSRYDKITEKDFLICVEYPKDNGKNYLEITVRKQPPYIKNLVRSPQKVEYILEKK